MVDIEKQCNVDEALREYEMLNQTLPLIIVTFYAT